MVVRCRETCNNCSDGVCHLYHFPPKDSPGLFIRRQLGSTVTACANSRSGDVYNPCRSRHDLDYAQLTTSVGVQVKELERR
jgi:hypothetical protein